MNYPIHTNRSLEPAREISTRFLKSSGEMGRRIAEFDWSKTPLGPIESWSGSIRTALSLMLNSQHPMWIGWGPEVTFLYNDAYITVLSQAKHPWALGKPAEVVWSEIWDFCGPLARKVFDEGEATFIDDVQLFMDRGDFLEEVYFSFSYSPITDIEGAVSGLFCPSTDASSKNLNARRLKTLSKLSSNALHDRFTDAACATVAATLAENPDDIPFTVIYLFDEQSGALCLKQAVRIEAGSGEFLWNIPLEGSDEGFQGRVRACLQAGVQSILPANGLPGLPAGLANQPLREILLLPMATSERDKPIGIVIAGASPARRLDSEYLTFFGLLIDQIDSAIRNARSSEEQERRVQSLADLDRAKTLFFSNVSHEFRTPLTLMVGPLDDLLASGLGDDNPFVNERLRLVRKNTLRLQRLVNTLLDFSRVQAGRMAAAFVPVQLSELTADLASGFRSLIESVGLTFEVDCPPLIAPTSVDPGMWEKIVMNLLSNAFKFTFEGKIVVRLREKEGWITLVVSDTGVGIPADALPQIFQRFQRVEGALSRTHEGSGIGLALVQDLVGLHGGRIDAESQPGVGTTFTIAVPVKRSEASFWAGDASAVATSANRATIESFTAEAASWIAEPDGSQPSRDPLSNAPEQRRGRILVADDNPDMRLYLRRLLENLWQVETVANGVEALRAIDRVLPDLVVSDVMMPEMTGFELIAHLRARERTRSIPIIVLSARAGDEARVEGLTAGADDYLVKPFSSRELVARVESQMLKSRMNAVEADLYRRMSTVFTHMPIAIAILSGSDHVFELANPAYLDLLGNRPILGKPMREAAAGLQPSPIIERLDEVFRSGKPFVAQAMPSTFQPGFEGAAPTRYYDVVCQPLFDARNEVESIAMVATDVTVATRAGQNAELASRTKDEFLAMLGHELRNPLTPILLSLDIMRIRGGDMWQREHSVIERQTRHMVRLVDDLLDVSRIAEGKIALKLEEVELSAVVARAIELASPLIEERRHLFKTDVPAQGILIFADSSRMAQVFSNLLMNAAKYTDPGGTVELHGRLEGSEAVLQVIDSGVGISEASLPYIFDKFVQERQTIDRARGGMGLGLAIARSITQLHHGSIHAHSGGPGQGSAFTVRLPLAAVATRQASPDAAIVHDNRRSFGESECPRVLVIDDSADIVAMLEGALKMEGYHVRSVLDPLAAIRIAREFKPTVALVDIGLPVMDGYELLRELKKLPELTHTRFLAVTGYGQTGDRKRSAAAGFAGHLVKPLDIAQLRLAIEHR